MDKIKKAILFLAECIDALEEPNTVDSRFCSCFVTRKERIEKILNGKE